MEAGLRFHTAGRVKWFKFPGLEEGEVVTRYPLVNQRMDHYRRCELAPRGKKGAP